MALLEAFDIFLDRPSSTTFFPGQTVSGKVLTKSYFEVDVKGLNLTFDGQATVKWTEETTQLTTPSPSIHLVQAVAPQIQQVTRTDSCTYFHFDRYLFGDGKSTMKFPSGENSYDFAFQIPPIDLPASYATKFCTVEYILEAKFENSGAFGEYKARKVIKIAPLVDLNSDPAMISPGGSEIHKNLGQTILCCTGGRVSIQGRIPWKGYCAGETIGLIVDVENDSLRDVKDVTVDLVQEDTYMVGTYHKTERQELFKSSWAHKVLPLLHETWHLSVKIPETAPPTDLGLCQIIKVQYNLVIKAKVSRSMKKLSMSIPITIGTIPLRQPVGTSKPSMEPGVYPSLPKPAGWNV